MIRRLLRLRALSALLLALPGLALTGWYAWNAFADADRYRRAYGAKGYLTVERAHIALHDRLRRDLRRLRQPPPGLKGKLPRLSLNLDGKALDQLLAGARKASSRRYAKALLRRKSERWPAGVRLRGNKHWHLLGRQKSLKVRLPRGRLFDGMRVFNLINDPMPMVVAEDLILAQARALGLLTPHSQFVRLELNGADMGVYRLEAQPDEGLLRAQRRLPGSVYSGNVGAKADEMQLWRAPDAWKKVASRNGAERTDRSDLARLLRQVREASYAEFVRFARDELDMDAFARHDALDVVFGGSQHDFRSNHKLYRDPYRGRWEPIAWNFRGFKDDPQFNAVENPIGLRLKLVPEYLSRRNRIVYELLVGDCSPAALRERGERMLMRLRKDLASDRHWDAYKLLPRVDRFSRQMVRPMDFRRLALVYDSELTTYGWRQTMLLRLLRRNPLGVWVGQRGAEHTPVTLVIDGEVGVALSALEVDIPTSCADRSWQLEQVGGVPLMAPTVGSRVTLKSPLPLYPGVRTVRRARSRAGTGNVRAQAFPLAYDFRLRSRCGPLRIEVEAVHLATRSRVRARPLALEVAQRARQDLPAPREVPSLVEPGAVSPHPSALAPPAENQVHLGPGLVNVHQTRVFGPRDTVTVAAGTRIAMAPGASLVFRGPTRFQGSQEAPIVVSSANGARWAGIALQGPETAGSSMRHVTIEGGTRPAWRQIPYPALLNLHQTRDITLADSTLVGGAQSEELLHAAYVERLQLRDIELRDAGGDGIDLEFCSATLQNVRVRRSGDDALDLMGTRVELIDSSLVGCGGNGVSAGEESQIALRDSLVARCAVGVLAKNASTVDLSSVVLFGNPVGVRLYRRSNRYAGDSRVRATTLHVLGAKQAFVAKDRARRGLKVGRLQRWLPSGSALDHLRDDVLRLDAWGALEQWVEEATRRPAR